MIALREGATTLGHEHFHSGILEGQSFSIPPICSFCPPDLIREPDLTHSLPTVSSVLSAVQSKKKNDQFVRSSLTLDPPHRIYADRPAPPSFVQTQYFA